MIRRVWASLRARVILTYLVIFLLSAGIIVVLSGSLFARIALENAQRNLQVQAYTIANALTSSLRGPGEEGTVTLNLPALRQLDMQVTLLDMFGNARDSTLAITPGNQHDQPEVLAALQGYSREDVRWDRATGQQMIYVAAPVQRGTRVVGVIQVMTPAGKVLAQVRDFWFRLGLTVLLAALAAALAGWLLASQIARPVRRVRDAAARLAAGDLEERVPDEDTAGIAEIGQLAYAFNHMAEQVADMIERQRYFVASASHELRTPLTNIKLRAEALGNGAMEDRDVAQRFVADIENEANRMGRMAGDLLTLSRQDAGATGPREPVDAAALVASTAEEMSMRAERNGVRLVQNVEPDLPPIKADPNGLRTVMVNLVDNALQYTPSGGSIILKACLSDPGAGGRGDGGGSGRSGSDYGPNAGAGRALILQVADTGAGIPAEDLPHIFERFYRADKARSRRLAQRGNLFGSGAGLGLAIVHGIVDEHGGTVTADSTLGEGTTITVTLPMDAPAPDLGLRVEPEPAPQHQPIGQTPVEVRS